MTEESPRLRLGAGYRTEVGPEHVGRRVTIRHRVQEDGRQMVTDVVGHLRAWEDDRLQVERRDGSLVEVDADAIVASRLIPDAPPRRRGPGPSGTG